MVMIFAMFPRYLTGLGTAVSRAALLAAWVIIKYYYPDISILPCARRPRPFITSGTGKPLPFRHGDESAVPLVGLGQRGIPFCIKECSFSFPLA